MMDDHRTFPSLTWACPGCGRVVSVPNPYYATPNLHCNHGDMIYVMVPMVPAVERAEGE